MTKFKPKRNFSHFKLAYIIILPALVIIFIVEPSWKNALFHSCNILAILTFTLLLVIWTTAYKIEDGYLKYRSLFIFGKIAIRDIRKLEVGKTLYVGMKPATAKYGIIVKYLKYEELYISPEDNQQMVDALLKENPNIELEYFDKDKKRMPQHP